jgi:hypothetical protein
VRGASGRPASAAAAHAQQQHRVCAGVGRPRQYHLPVLLDQAVGQGPAALRAGGAAAAEAPTTRPCGTSQRTRHRPARAPLRPGMGLAALRVAQRLIQGVSNGAPRPGQVAQQGIGVGQAEGAGHLVLLLEHQPVGGPAGHLVQRVPRVQDGLLGRPRSGPRSWRDPGGGDRVDRFGVPQAAPRFLEVGFEQEGEFTGSRGPLRVQRLHLGEPGAGRRPPVGERTETQVAGQLPVPGDMARIQQPQRDAHVAAGHLASVGRAAHGVVETGARVPDGVPDTVRQRRDSLPGTVQQQYVEVAARQQLTPPVSAHGHQRHPGLPAQQ